MDTKRGKKICNFSPGPAKVPESVLEKIAQNGLLQYEDTGISILAMSHRSKEFTDILKSSEKLLRDIMRIPPSYEVLFLQGGGTGQFAAIPLNLMHLSKGAKPSADYVVTGTWSQKAAKEAEKYLIVHKAINPPLHHYTRIPDQSHWLYTSDAAYRYYCANETVHGVEFNFVPESRNIPLVGDVSSNFLSRQIDVSKHGLVFAGAQKNAGKAGLTIVVVRNDLIGRADKMCPSVFNYKEQHSMGSVYNTPPVFSIFVTKLILEWIQEQGGLDAIAQLNQQKAQLVYDAIDDSQGFYSCPVHLDCRSQMNVPFHVGSPEGIPALEKLFINKAEERGLISLKGHRSVGGIRASLYNAVTMEETQTLVDFMHEFYEIHGEKEP